LKERPIPLGIKDTLNNVHSMLGDDKRDKLKEEHAFVKVLNAKNGGMDLAFNMQGDLSICIWYKKVMYTNDDMGLPVHLQKLLSTYQWGPFGKDKDCWVVAVSEESFEGELFDLAGETFCVINFGEVE
jgi:hypothetical protein